MAAAVFQLAAIPMATFDASLQLVEWNRAFAACTGCTSGDVRLLDLFRADDHARVLAAVQGLLHAAHETTWAGGLDLRHLDGDHERRPISITVLRRPGQAGEHLLVQVPGFVTPGPDDSSVGPRRFISIAGQLGRFGVWRWHPDDQVLELSQQALVLLRCRKTSKLVPTEALRIFSSVDRRRIFDFLQTAVHRGTAFELEVEESLAGGNCFRITGEPVWSADGSVIEVQGAIQDITDTKRLRASLVESERALQALIANLNGIVYRCANAPDWPLTFVSEGATALTGYSPELLLAQSPAFGQLIFPEDAVRIWSEVQSALALRSRYQLRYRIRTAQGQVKWVWEQGSGVFGPENELSHLEGFITDITEAEQAKEEVRRLNEDLEATIRTRTAQLEAANADLKAFAYSLAHDLRAPITAVTGFGEALSERAKGLDEASKKHLQRIVHNGHRMGELVDALLALARLSNAKLQRQSIDVSAMAGEVLAGLAEQEPGRTCEIVVQPEMTAVGDPRLVRLLLENLLGNAWKFSRPRQVTSIRVRSECNEDETAFVVEDNGVGFDRQADTPLFQPFRRFHSQSEFEGTGMGLAIVHKIIRQHGGHVWAESVPGSGARFYFTLPAIDCGAGSSGWGQL